MEFLLFLLLFDGSTGEMMVSSPKYNVQETPLSLYETRMTVTIRKFQKEDIGSYRCIAKNSLGEVDSSIRLYGLYSIFTPFTPQSTEGATISQNALSLSISPSLYQNSSKCPEIPDPKAGTGHNHNHHAHTTKYNANSNDLYKSYKQPHQPHRPPKVTYQPISDDDDLFGSAEEYDDSDSVYLKPTKAPNDNAGFNGNANNNNNHHYHHHQYNANANNNGNSNNARYNNVPLFGNGIGGVGVGGNGGSNGANNNGNNAIVTRTEVRGSDNEVSAATASANIIFAFYKQNSRTDNNNSYSNYKLLLAINLLISLFSRLTSS